MITTPVKFFYTACGFFATLDIFEDPPLNFLVWIFQIAFENAQKYFELKKQKTGKTLDQRKRN